MRRGVIAEGMEAVTAIDCPTTHQCMDFDQFQKFKVLKRDPICESFDEEFVHVEFEPASVVVPIGKGSDEAVDSGC